MINTRHAANPLIVNGVPWFDDRGRPVNAHGGCLLEEHGTYYLFGEYKTDDENHFAGFSCYSSTDLAHWTFRRIVLPQQHTGLMGPGRVGERVKVMLCPDTGCYVMYMHSDDLEYRDPHICFALCDTIDGEYEFVGPLEYQGEPIRRWDLGTFQDDDGTGYLLVHEGDIYRLSREYITADERVSTGVARGGEAPAIAKIEGRYWMMLSNKTSWDSNDNYCLSAPSLSGPWTYQGLFAPEGSMTCNSQCLSVFPLHTAQGTVPMYMGDRWSFPHQASAATCVWLPLTVDHGNLAIAEYWNAWDPGRAAPVAIDGSRISVGFEGAESGDGIEIPFTISSDTGRAALFGRADPYGSYATIGVMHCGGEYADTVAIAPIYVSFYAKVPDLGCRYLTAELPRGDYVLTVTVCGKAAQWEDKTGQRYGSVGSAVTVDALVVVQR